MCDVLKQTNMETKSETSVVSYSGGEDLEIRSMFRESVNAVSLTN